MLISTVSAEKQYRTEIQYRFCLEDFFTPFTKNLYNKAHTQKNQSHNYILCYVSKAMKKNRFQKTTFAPPPPALLINKIGNFLKQISKENPKI